MYSWVLSSAECLFSKSSQNKMTKFLEINFVFNRESLPEILFHLENGRTSKFSWKQNGFYLWNKHSLTSIQNKTKFGTKSFLRKSMLEVRLVMKTRLLGEGKVKEKILDSLKTFLFQWILFGKFFYRNLPIIYEFLTKMRVTILKIQRALLNGIPDNVINRLMGSNLFQLISPIFSFIPSLCLSSFAYCYQWFIVIKLAWPKVVPLSGT